MSYLCQKCGEPLQPTRRVRTTEVRKLLAKFVYDGWTPTMARRQNRISADSGHLNWSYTKGVKLAGVENIDWSVTIADIQLETTERYCADVKHWAESVLTDCEALIRSVEMASSS